MYCTWLGLVKFEKCSNAVVVSELKYTWLVLRHTILKETNISTGGCQTSWLFTCVTEELNKGLPRNSSRLVVRAGLELVTCGL